MYSLFSPICYLHNCLMKHKQSFLNEDILGSTKELDSDVSFSESEYTSDSWESDKKNQHEYINVNNSE